MPLSRHSSVLHRLAIRLAKSSDTRFAFVVVGSPEGQGVASSHLGVMQEYGKSPIKKKTVGAWLCGYVEHKQTFILVKIDYCGYDLKPVTLHHQNNYKKVS